MYVAVPPNPYDVLDAATGKVLDALSSERGSPVPGYPHWDKLRHLNPPAGITSEQWWAGIRLARNTAQRTVPLTSPTGGTFGFCLPDAVLRGLRYVDQRCSGEIAMAEVVTHDEQSKRRYLVNAQMEEAIRSSQLEGATTSRTIAKEMLRSGRQPNTRSERMIVNNYRALEYMRDGIGDALTPASVLELQRILTEGTLDNPDAAGRLQRPDEERVAVYDRLDGSLLHSPPPADQLPARLEAMCDFANASEDSEPFVHPVIRGILLHFWLAYDHPFEDGNGRTARTLFYWYMRTHGYWLVEYLSISAILRDAPGKYSRSFLLTETDDGDTTYFLLYQLEVIERAVEELHKYLDRKMAEVRDAEPLLRNDPSLNHRQADLLGDALRHPERTYTFGEHSRNHGVTHETARTDLSTLADRGLLIARNTRPRQFDVPRDLSDRLRSP